MIVGLQKTHERIERRLIEGLSRLLGPKGGHPRRDGLLKCVQFSSEIAGLLRLQTVFEPVIKGQAVMQLDHLALIRRARRRFHPQRLAALAFDRGQRVGQVAVGEVKQAGFLQTLPA